MKKLLTVTLLVSVSVGVASAANINWKIGGSTNKFYDKNGDVLAPVSAYLLLAADYEKWDAGLTSASSVSAISAALSAASLDGAKTYTDLSTSGTFTSSSSKLTAGGGNRYDFYLIVLNPTTGEYLDLGKQNNLAYADGATATTITWTAAQSVFTTTPGKTQYNANAWATVPEPATGALALAGVALLFRRRRA